MHASVVVVAGDPAVKQRLRDLLPELGWKVFVAEQPDDVDRLVEELAADGIGPIPLADGARISTQGLEIDARRFRCFVEGRELKLTLTEFRLLYTLARGGGVVFTRQELATSCLGAAADTQQRTIDVHIKTLRQKLAERADLVETVRGVGYRFRDEGLPNS